MNTTYAAIQAALKPRQRTMSVAEYQAAIIESLHPHTVGDDQDYATPINCYRVKALMERFAHPVRVLFAVTGAEMVMPNWERWIAEHTEIPRYHGKPINPQAPQKAIAAYCEWLHAVQIGDEIKINKAKRLSVAWRARALAAAWTAWSARSSFASETRAKATYSASAKSAADAAGSAWAWSPRQTSAEAAARAVQKAAEAAESATKFYADWWRRCRCRLAVADPSSVEFGPNAPQDAALIARR